MQPPRILATGAVFLIGLTAGSTGVAVTQPAPPELFSLSGSSIRLALAPRGRAAAVHTHAERLLAIAAPTRVVLEPLPGVRLEAMLQPHLEPGIGTVWTGGIVGDPLGYVHLRASGGGIGGSIGYEGGELRLVPWRGDLAAVIESDDLPALPDIVVRRPQRGDEAARVRPAASSTSAPSTLDLLVVVDRQALAESPTGMPFIADLVRSSIVDLNAALRNSAVDAQVRLLKIKRDTYRPEGSDTAYGAQYLEHLAGKGDGHLEKVHRWRDRFGADLVALISRKNEELCGIADLPGERTGVRPTDAVRAFSLTNWRCLARNTLPHEIGHTMGAQHSRGEPYSHTLGAYDYSFGYKFDLGFRTLMAYACELQCRAVPHFSNPDVLVDGKPTGIASGPEQAANAWGFERDRAVLAAYRPCRVNC